MKNVIALRGEDEASSLVDIVEDTEKKW